ncbi:hypothetical protein EDB83DRAFT_2323101 [Lactarius deliciosus]|nr:hypothetical protein EDB83DRAFT_2323101 [Lactarius deliciosus]
MTGQRRRRHRLLCCSNKYHVGGVGGDASGPSGAPAWWWRGAVGVAWIGGLVTGDASGLSSVPAWWWRGAVGVACVGVLSVARVVSVAMRRGRQGKASESEVATLWAASELAWWWWALQMALGVLSRRGLACHNGMVSGGGGVAWRGDGGGELEAKAKDDGGGYGVDVWRSGGSDVALRQ